MLDRGTRTEPATRPVRRLKKTESESEAPLRPELSSLVTTLTMKNCHLESITVNLSMILHIQGAIRRV